MSLGMATPTIEELEAKNERLRMILAKLIEDIDGGFPRDDGYDLAVAELGHQQGPQTDKT